MAAGESPPFDAVIPFHAKDAEVLPYCISGLRRYAKGLRHIYVVSKEQPDEDDILWIPETLFPFSKADVATVIQSTNGREGWYFQQLLKMYAFEVIADILPHVLLFDSDCVVCKPISFFDAEGRILLDWSDTGRHSPYFAHARAVMGDLFREVHPDRSGITDHMMVHRPVMQGLLYKIEQRGGQAWRILLEAVEPAHRNLSGMSEYEIYFNYALTWFAEEYALRQLARGMGSSFRALTEGSTEVDIIAIHAWCVELHKTQIESSRIGGAASGGTGSGREEAAEARRETQ
jgi:hypothetical protein